ncbi:hypothetical protein PHSC3_001444 [Chlamydiales bacterium STE3]|nr:hypothetical protein PHSC3_001444 [Chlamydiales bacterium STE3]
MNIVQTESLDNVPSRVVFGPICVLFSVTLLYFKESPFFVALTSAALLGILLCWKWERNGMMVAMSTLMGVLFYEWQWGSDSLTLWELGLASSLGIAFFITSLAKQEISELIEDQASEQIETLQAEYASIQEVLKKYEKVLKEKNQKIDALEQSQPISSQNVLQPGSFPQDGLNEEVIQQKNALIEELQKKVAFAGDADQLKTQFEQAQELLQNQQKTIQEQLLEIDFLKKGNSLTEQISQQQWDGISFEEILKRYEAAVQERNLIIDELHERLDKIDVSASVVPSDPLSGTLKDALQEKEHLIHELMQSQANLATMEMKVREFEAILQERVKSNELADHLQHELNAAEERFRGYEEALQEKSLAIAQLEERAKAAELVDHLQDELTAVEEKFRSYEEVLREKSLAIAQLEERAKAAELVDHLQHELNAAEEKFISYEEALQKKSLAIAQLEERAKAAELVDHLQHELNAAEEKFISYEEALQEKSLAIAQLEERTKAAELVDHLQHELIAAKENLEQYQENLERQNALIETLNEKAQETQRLEEEISFAIESLKNYEEALQEKNITIESLEKKAQKAQQVAVLEEKLAEMQLVFEREEARRAVLEKELHILLEKTSDSRKLEETLQAKERQVQQLEESYKSLRDQVKEHEVFNFSKLLEKDRLVEIHINRVKDLERQIDDYKSQLDALKTLQLEKAEVNHDYESKVESLNSQLEKLLEKLKKIESEKASLEQELAQTEKEPKNSVARELARVQGMYKQLREQFDEKSRVLDKTRRELFLTTEEKNKLELEYLEETKYGHVENFAQLERYVLDLTQLVENQEQEIEVLQELLAKNINV